MMERGEGGLIPSTNVRVDDVSFIDAPGREHSPNEVPPRYYVSAPLSSVIDIPLQLGRTLRLPANQLP